MQSQVKKFDQFVNEHDFGIFDNIINKPNKKPKVAKVYLSSGMGGEFATIVFRGKEVEVDEMTGLQSTWRNILSVAKQMGADVIYSVDDEEIITEEMIESLDDTF